MESDKEIYRRTLDAYKQAVTDLEWLVGKCSVEGFQQAVAKADAARKAFEALRTTNDPKVEPVP